VASREHFFNEIGTAEDIHVLRDLIGNRPSRLDSNNTITSIQRPVYWCANLEIGRFPQNEMDPRKRDHSDGALSRSLSCSRSDH
jgi:hypothetical protein